VLPIGISRMEKTKRKIKIGNSISWGQFNNITDFQKITDQIIKEIAKLSNKIYPYGD